MITSILINSVEYINYLTINAAKIRYSIEKDINMPSSSILQATFLDSNETLYNTIKGKEEYSADLAIQVYWDGTLAFEGYIDPEVSYDMNWKTISIKAVDMTKYYADKFALYDITQLYFTPTTEDDMKLWGRNFSPNRANFGTGTMAVNSYYHVSDLVQRMIEDVTGLSSSNIQVVIPNSTHFMWKYNSTRYGSINTIKRTLKKKIKQPMLRRAVLKLHLPYLGWLQTPDDTSQKENIHNGLGLLNEFAQLTGCIHFYAQGKYFFVSRDYDFSADISKDASYDLLAYTINGEFQKHTPEKYLGLEIITNDDNRLFYDGTNYEVSYLSSGVWTSTDEISYYLRADKKTFFEVPPDDDYYAITGFLGSSSYPNFNLEVGKETKNSLTIRLEGNREDYRIDDTAELIWEDTSIYPMEYYYQYDVQNVLDAMYSNYSSVLNSTETYSVKVNMVDLFPSWIEVDFYKYNILDMKVDLIEETSEFEVRV